MHYQQFTAAAALLLACSGAMAQETVLTETFPDPLSSWQSGWFYQNSNAENFYVAQGNCNPDDRGNQPEGLWISDDRGCGTLAISSPVRIDFGAGFGSNASSFSIDHFTCIEGVTFNVYDRNGALYASEPLAPNCFVWSHYELVLDNGISAFEYAYTSGQVEGNTSIDNVTLVMEEGPSCDVDEDGDYDRDDVRAYNRACLQSGGESCFAASIDWAVNSCGGMPPR